jgi:hypothetical protein
VDERSPRLTEHFLTLSVLHDGRWFVVSRYHDVDYVENGPEALAQFLALSIDEVFPIAYDLRPLAKGDPAALAGKIFKEPRERLSRAEIVAMAVPRKDFRPRPGKSFRIAPHNRISGSTPPPVMPSGTARRLELDDVPVGRL